VHQHSVQLAYAVTQRREVYHPVAEIAHLQLYAHLDEPGINAARHFGLAKHLTQIQMYPLCVGTAKLPPQDEDGHCFPDSEPVC
jgi:hypothetical protein